MDMLYHHQHTSLYVRIFTGIIYHPAPSPNLNPILFANLQPSLNRHLKLWGPASMSSISKNVLNFNSSIVVQLLGADQRLMRVDVSTGWGLRTPLPQTLNQPEASNVSNPFPLLSTCSRWPSVKPIFHKFPRLCGSYWLLWFNFCQKRWLWCSQCKQPLPSAVLQTFTRFLPDVCPAIVWE